MKAWLTFVVVCGFAACTAHHNQNNVHYIKKSYRITIAIDHKVGKRSPVNRRRMVIVCRPVYGDVPAQQKVPMCYTLREIALKYQARANGLQLSAVS